MRTLIPSSVSRPTAGVAVAAVLVAGLAGTVRRATAGDVAVVADGRTVHVAARSLADARQAALRAGVAVGDHDRVLPAGRVHDGTTVTVGRAHAYTLTLDGVVSTQWSTAGTVGQALGLLLGDRLHGAAVSLPTDMPLYPDRVTVEVSTVKRATVRLAGRTRPVTSNAATVAGLLRDAHVTLGGRDLTVPGADAPVTDRMTVSVDRLAPGQHTITSEIPFATVRRPSAELPVGTTRVASPGEPGQRLSVFEDVLRNGRRVETRLVSRVVAVPSRPRIVLVGTGAPTTSTLTAMTATSPPPDTVRAATSADPKRRDSTAPVAASGPVGDTVWDRLATCESGNDWQINSGNGYYGGLQFDLTTWQAYGGTGYPYEHTRDEQIAVAERLRAARGFYPWPVCGRRLGLIPTG